MASRRRTERFVERLREATELPVEASTSASTALARQAGETRAAEDAVAAAHLRRATCSGRRAPAPREGLPEERGSRIAAFLGVVVGFALIAAIAWAVVGLGPEAAAPPGPIP